MHIRALLMILLLAFAQPSPRYFRYQRELVGVSSQGQTCAAIDVATFAHASPGLADLRLYRNGSQEVPYVLRIAEPVTTQQADIQPLNLGSRNGKVVFDAAMPQGSYRSVNLHLRGKNFIASVTVTGSQAQDESAITRLGTYNVFDLTDQRLGRSTVLHLPVSDFRYLHFQIGAPIQPEDVAGLSIESEPVQLAEYLTIAETASVAQQGRSSVVEFTVPANVPVERVEFAPAGTPANFSRSVSIAAAPAASGKNPETLFRYSGEIRRVHGTHTGLHIDDEQLTVPLANDSASTSSRWTVKIDNGDDQPLTLTAVRLQMKKRTLCFDAAAGASYMLAYGDAALAAPRYDYATFFQPDKDAAQATLRAEHANPQYEPRPDERPFTEKHPALLWIALVLAVLVLGGVALRSARQVAPRP